MSKYTPYIQKLDFTNNILDQTFDLIESKVENQPKFNLGYHYYTKQVREKMQNEEFKRRDYYLVVNEFENNIPNYKEDLDNIIPKKSRSINVLKFSIIMLSACTGITLKRITSA